MSVWIARIAAVVLLLTAAAVLATDASRLPPALRGLAKTLARDAGRPAADSAARASGVSPGRRLAALVLVLLAFAACVVDF